jgi:tetratricopeptide (TPR) repeat protein
LPESRQEKLRQEDGDSTFRSDDPIELAKGVLYYALFILAVVYISVLCHEGGHAVMAWLCGIRVTAFGTGTGKPFFFCNCRGVRMYLGLQRPLQGLTLVFPEQVYLSRLQVTGFFLGGVFAHLLLASIGLWLLWQVPGLRHLWYSVVAVNGVYAIANLLPGSPQIGPYQAKTDGARILAYLRTGGFNSPAPARLGVYRLLHPLLVKIGDRVGSRNLLQTAADSWREMGVLDQADELCLEALDRLDELPPVSQALLRLSQCLIASESGRSDEAREALQQAEQTFRALDHEAGLFVAKLASVDLLRTTGELTEALATLDSLVAHPLTVRPEVQAALTASRIEVAASLAESAEIPKLRTKYETLRRLCPSSTRDLTVYRALGRWYASRQSWAEAADTYRLLLHALQDLHKSLGAEDQKQFLEAHAGLLDEIKTSLCQARGQEAVEIAFDTASDAQEQAAGKRARGDRRLVRAGGLIAVLNVLLGLVGVHGVLTILDQPGTHEGLWCATQYALVLLLPFALLGGSLFLVRILIGVFAPTARYRFGFLDLAVGALGWGICLGFALAASGSPISP